MYKGKLKSGTEYGPVDDISGNLTAPPTSDCLNFPVEYNDAYTNLSKSSLVQESKIFNEKQISERKCIDLLNKIIFLLNQVSPSPYFLKN